MFDYMKKDSKSVGSAIVGGVQQVVDPFKLCPANPNAMNSTATPPANDKLSVSPESSPESKSAKPSDAFRFKGRITAPKVGPGPDKRDTKKIKVAVQSPKGSTNKPGNDPPLPPPPPPPSSEGSSTVQGG